MLDVLTDTLIIMSMFLPAIIVMAVMIVLVQEIYKRYNKQIIKKVKKIYDQFKTQI